MKTTDIAFDFLRWQLPADANDQEEPIAVFRHVSMTEKRIGEVEVLKPQSHLDRAIFDPAFPKTEDQEKAFKQALVWLDCL